MAGKRVLQFGVYEKLLAEIVSGRIAPGANLREEQIAEDIGVSRTPVREALRRLAEEGFLEYFPHRGAKMMSLTPDRVREIFEVREALEGIAARHAARRMGAGQIAELKQRFQVIESNVAAGDFSDVGDVIHTEILANCGNERLLRLMSGIRGQVTWMQRVAIDLPGRLPRAYADHCTVLRALEERNSDAAENAMRSHIRGTMEDLVNAVPAKKDSGDGHR